MGVHPSNSIQKIKKDLDLCVGKRVRLRANRGRKKVMEAEGVLERTYPNVFVIKLDKCNAVKRISYSYADVLTESVELMFEEKRTECANM